MSPTRAYQKKARARAEEQTGEAILDAAWRAFSSEPFDRVTLQQIAGESGVTVQTVIRRFGSKEDLFSHLAEREGERIIADREVPEQKGLEAALTALIQHYERDGDTIINLLSQEHLFEPVRDIVKRGRRVHCEWVERHCRHLLDGLSGAEHKQTLLAAIAATDLSTWKLLRRDYGLKPEAVAAVMIQLLNGINGG
jgi:AcrR family transcriptional regulator